MMGGEQEKKKDVQNDVLSFILFGYLLINNRWSQAEAALITVL